MLMHSPGASMLHFAIGAHSLTKCMQSFDGFVLFRYEMLLLKRWPLIGGILLPAPHLSRVTTSEKMHLLPTPHSSRVTTSDKMHLCPAPHLSCVTTSDKMAFSTVTIRTITQESAVVNNKSNKLIIARRWACKRKEGSSYLYTPLSCVITLDIKVPPVISNATITQYNN